MIVSPVSVGSGARGNCRGPSSAIFSSARLFIVDLFFRILVLESIDSDCYIEVDTDIILAFSYSFSARAVAVSRIDWAPTNSMSF